MEYYIDEIINYKNNLDCNVKTDAVVSPADSVSMHMLVKALSEMKAGRAATLSCIFGVELVLCQLPFMMII